MIASINTFTPLWLILLGFFFVVEFTALRVEKKGGEKDGTLSDLVWRFIAWKKGHRIWRLLFAAFWIDLTLHFFLGTPLLPF